jgi:hypothetical protein
VRGPAVLNTAQLNDVVAVSPRSAWAVGATRTAALALHWDGRTWTVADATEVGRQLTAVASAPGGTVWAAGLSGRASEAARRTGTVARYGCGA